MLTKPLPLVPHVSTVHSLTPHLSSLQSNLILYSTDAKYLIQSGSSASESRPKICPLCFMSYGCYIPWPVHSPWVYLPKRPMSGKNRACVLWRSNITSVFSKPQTTSLPPNQAHNWYTYQIPSPTINWRCDTWTKCSCTLFSLRAKNAKNLKYFTFPDNKQIQRKFKKHSVLVI